jgi:hypothetical protein
MSLDMIHEVMGCGAEGFSTVAALKAFQSTVMVLVVVWVPLST